MKKMTLMALTVLSLTGLLGTSLTANAAPLSTGQLNTGGNRVYYAFSSNCNISNILDMLQNCLPGITLPECNAPETDTPENNVPENNLPGTNTPGTDSPEGTPDTSIPGTDSPENTPDTNVPGTEMPEDAPENEHAFIRQVVTLVNAERAKEGLAPLKLDTKVSAAAQVRAKECEQRFSHTRPNGSSFSTALKEQNVSYRSAGENIAWGQQTPEAVMNAWMNSSGHRANIMNPNFTTIGVGYYENARGVDYWCQLFTR